MPGWPGSSSGETSGWAAELKWDGIRLQALCGEAGELSLRSSSGNDLTTNFPELRDLANIVGSQATLDGELVVFDGERPSFGLLQQRIHEQRPSKLLLQRHPVVFMVFDLLELAGNSLLSLPYSKRREVLENLVPESPLVKVPGFEVDNGPAMLAFAKEKDFEGIVLKRIDSIYRPGKRSHDWRKVKVTRRQEFVVGGWVAGTGSLSHTIGSLVFGVWEDGRLIRSGSVGSGLTDPERARISSQLVDVAVCPFAETPKLDKPVNWVLPELVIEVEFSEWTASGAIRHPTYRGQRIDKAAADVIREISGQ